MTNEYRRNLACKALLLIRIQELEHATGSSLEATIELDIAHAIGRDSEFDFIHWAGGNVSRQLDQLSSWGFISTDEALATPTWATRRVAITGRGRKFLESVETEIAKLLHLFHAEEVMVAAAQG